jgi:DNA-directed RNA polymerase subunit E'/Rpb7
MDPL